MWYIIPHTRTKISRTRVHTGTRQTDGFFFWDVSIRNSLRSKYNVYSYILRPSKCRFYFRPDMYRFEVRLELYGANACLVVSPPPLSSSHTPTQPPSRWPALSSLYPASPSFSSFGASCVELCCLPPPSLVRDACISCIVYV